MDSRAAHARQDVRYEPDDRPPHLLSVGLGLQYALLNVTATVLTPVIMIGSAGGSDAYLSWAVCAALVISGVTTVIQSVRIGRIGAGYVLLMGSSAAFLAVCVTALERGGQGLLSTLILVSCFFQFALAAKLSLLRKVFTPAVAGTVLMLIPVSVATTFLGKLTDVPEGASPAAAPVTASVTLAIMLTAALRFRGAWRLWAPVIGLVVGSAIGGFAFGIYDTASVVDAAWVGLPPVAHVGFDLGLGPAFWALLPAFVFVTLVGAMDTLGDTIAVQRVSWRRPRAIDFRSVQGSLFADSLGNLLAGLAGTVPNSTSAMSISVAELTGVAARAVGVCVGVIFVVLAFLPKFTAAIVAIPGPVVAAFYTVLIALLFVFGMKIVLHDGLDQRKSLIVGMGFLLGVAFQLDWIFPEYLQGAWGELLGNGMTVGGFTVMLLTLFDDLTAARRVRLRVTLNADAYPKMDAMLSRIAAGNKWNEEMTARVRAVGEETLLLLRDGEQAQPRGDRQMLLIARADGHAAVLEFIAATDETNIEDQMAVLKDRPGAMQVEEEVSLRLLRHYASSVRHHQYHDTDVVTVRVEPAVSP